MCRIGRMTTAATIWVNAAVGMAAGAGEFLMATITTVITLLVLANHMFFTDPVGALELLHRAYGLA